MVPLLALQALLSMQFLTSIVSVFLLRQILILLARLLCYYIISRENCSVDLSAAGGPGQSLLALVFPDTHTSPYSSSLIFLHDF